MGIWKGADWRVDSPRNEIFWDSFSLFGEGLEMAGFCDRQGSVARYITKWFTEDGLDWIGG